MYIQNQLITKNNKPNLNNILSGSMILIQEGVDNFFSKTEIFKPENYRFFTYDEYTINTEYDSDQIIATVYVEINQPANYKPVQKEVKNDTIAVPNLYLKLEDIKKGFASEFIKLFDNNTLIWESIYGVNFTINNKEENGENINYYFRVIPCFTYTNTNNINGIIYYDNSLKNIEIEYPLLSISNYYKKDENTFGKLSEYSTILKNLFLIASNEKFIPFEFIEILLYNVPDNLFGLGNFKDNLLSIINFLRNNNFKDYKTIDEQDFAFSSKYKSLSLIFAKSVIKRLENIIKKEI